MFVTVSTNPVPCQVSDILVACPLSHLLEDDLKNLLYISYHDQVKSTTKVDTYTAIKWYYGNNVPWNTLSDPLCI